MLHAIFFMDSTCLDGHPYNKTVLEGFLCHQSCLEKCFRLYSCTNDNKYIDLFSANSNLRKYITMLTCSSSSGEHIITEPPVGDQHPVGSQAGILIVS